MASNIMLSMERDQIIVKRIISGRLYERTVPSTGFVTAPEAAALLNIGIRHVYRLMDNKALPRCKRGGRVLIPCNAVKRRMEIKTIERG
jgi:excisionase family DNA binding protein